MICLFGHCWDFWEFTGWTQATFVKDKKDGVVTDYSTLELTRKCIRCGKDVRASVKTKDYGKSITREGKCL